MPSVVMRSPTPKQPKCRTVLYPKELSRGPQLLEISYNRSDFAKTVWNRITFERTLLPNWLEIR